MRSAVLLALSLLGACIDDPQQFNERQAEQLCKLESKCGDWDYDSGEAQDGSCRDNRMETLDRCAEICDYDNDAAVLCVRALTRALRPALFGPDCALEDEDLAACDQVYVNCKPSPSEQVHCPLPYAESSCAVGGAAPPTLALLLLLPWLARRRR